MKFNDFIHKYNLKNKATSNIKTQQVLGSLGLDNVRIYLRDGLYEFDIGIAKLDPVKGTHWVCFMNEIYFDSYACPALRKLF